MRLHIHPAALPNQPRTRSGSPPGRRWPNAGVTQQTKPSCYTKVTAVDLIHSPSAADPSTPGLPVHSPSGADPRRCLSFLSYDHLGPVSESGGEWYDIVCGPVAAFWDQRSAMNDADQISFHTITAAKLLTDLIKSGNSTEYEWKVVT